MVADFSGSSCRFTNDLRIARLWEVTLWSLRLALGPMGLDFLVLVVELKANPSALTYDRLKALASWKVWSAMLQARFIVMS